MRRLVSGASLDATLNPTRLIAYYRVSTNAQERSGLGLSAQEEAVFRYAVQHGATLIDTYQEVESGRKNDRTELGKALEACRQRGAALIVAKLDRLSRDAMFLLSVANGCGDAGIIFCDMPQLPPGPMGRLLLTLMAGFAEFEAGIISERTKAALAVLKARGVQLGNPQFHGDGPAARRRKSRRRAREIMPYIRQAQDAGAKTLKEIGEALAHRGVLTPGGKREWLPTTVRRVLIRKDLPINLPPKK